MPVTDHHEHRRSADDIVHDLTQDHRDFWERLGNDFLRRDDHDARQRAAFHVGALKKDFEAAIRHPADRTVRQDVEYRLAAAGLPNINTLIDRADKTQLRHIIDGMATGLPEDD